MTCRSKAIMSTARFIQIYVEKITSQLIENISLLTILITGT